LQYGQDRQKEDGAPNLQFAIRAPELLGQSEKFNKKMAGLRHLGSGFKEWSDACQRRRIVQRHDTIDWLYRLGQKKMMAVT
jgi:hypothetical protein